MKFVISTQELNYLINKCLNVVAAQQKTTIPILSNFLIEAANDELIVTATDLTVGVRCVTEAKIIEEGSTTLPAKKFSQLARELTAVNVELNTGTNEITEISANSSRFKLNGMSRNEFPSFPDVSESIQFQIKQEDLKRMLSRTSFAVSKDDDRYILTGVWMSIKEGIATFVGTDGKRLARSCTTIAIDPSFCGNYTIPLKAVDEIVKNLNSDEEAIVSLMHDKIAVKASNTTIVTKLLSGEYPDIQRVIPERLETVVSLHREELITLLRQIALFTAESTHSVRFLFSEGELKLNANSMDLGEGKVSMPVNYHGPKLEIAFNPHYFLDILRHVDTETVTMGITDAYNPGLITDNETMPANSLELNSLFVLMPMRLNEE